MAKEVEVQVVKQKRVRRGRGGLNKKEREQQEDEDDEEDPDTVTVSRREWEEMEEMKKTMKNVVERLAIGERALKRSATSEEGGKPATKKIRLPTIKDKYFE